MRVRTWLQVTGAILLLAPAAFVQMKSDSQGKGGEDEFGPYEPVPNWPEPLAGQVRGSEGFTWGSTAGVFAETPDKIFIVQRGELPLPPEMKPGMPVWGVGLRASHEKFRPGNFVLVVDADGKLINDWTWNDKLLTHPHSVFISPYDPEKHVWIIDGDDANSEHLDWKIAGGGNQILEFTNDGKKLVMSLGVKDVMGADETHFGGPTGMAFLPDGSFFVSDGYVNSRVIKFDRNGRFLRQFGEKGEAGKETRPGYLNGIHSVAVGADGRVYVSDRSNSRIQIFDQNGKYLDQWSNIKMPNFLYATQDGHLWVADGMFQKIVEYELNGKFLYSWGTQGGGNGKGKPDLGSLPGAIFGVHAMCVDSAGNFYTAEVASGHAQKFRPKMGSDPAKLVGQPVKLNRIRQRSSH